MRATLFRLFLVGVTSCAGPPSRFSSRSAASLETDPAPTAGIGIALREDPPLPGRGAAGWSGLAPAAAPMDHSHHGHMHHGGGGAPEPDAATPEATTPDVPASEAVAPEATTPDVPAPEAVAPDAPAPERPADAHGAHHGH